MSTPQLLQRGRGTKGHFNHSSVRKQHEGREPGQTPLAPLLTGKEVRMKGTMTLSPRPVMCSLLPLQIAPYHIKVDLFIQTLLRVPQTLAGKSLEAHR